VKKAKNICKTCYFMDDKQYEYYTTHPKGWSRFSCDVNKNRDINIKCCENWIDRDVEKESKFVEFIIEKLESMVIRLENFKERLKIKPYYPTLYFDNIVGEFGRRGVLGHIPNNPWPRYFSDSFLIMILNEEIELVEEWGDKDENGLPMIKYYWRISIPEWYMKVYKKRMDVS